MSHKSCAVAWGVDRGFACVCVTVIMYHSVSGVSRVGIRGGGFSKSHKFKGLVKVGASKGVIRVD